MLRNAYWDLFKLMDLIDRKVRCAEMRDRHKSVMWQLANTYTYLLTSNGLLMPFALFPLS